MKKIINILFIVLLISIYACKKTIPSKSNSNVDHLTLYNSFFKQIGVNEDYNIYNFEVDNNLNIIETKIIKASIQFSHTSGVDASDIKIGKWISQDTLLLYNYLIKKGQPKDTFPEKVQYENYEDLVLKLETYRTNSWGRNPLEFKHFVIRDNKIEIHGIKNKYFKDVLHFPLGAVFFHMDQNKLEKIVINTLKKDMNHVMKQSNGEFIGNLPGIGISIFEFTPQKEISINTYENGIFYDIKNQHKE